MKHFIKCLSVLALSGSVTAYQSSVSPTQTPQDPNPSSRWGTKNRYNTYLSGEIIWLKPLNSEITKQTSSPDSYKFFSYDFQPGVRVALGLNTAYDGWDVVLTYTGLRYKHNNPFVYDTTLFGSTKYTYYFDQGDLDIGRMFKVSRRLSIRPHFGVRSLWLTQKGSWKYFSETSDSNFHDVARLKGTLVGGEMGVDTFWKISSEWCVYANLLACTLVNSQKAKFTNYNEDLHQGGSLEEVKKSNLGSKIVNGLDFMIGIRWDKTFSNGNYHFALNAGYEHHSLINVNSEAMLDILKSGTYLTQTDTDFTLQGIALGARFDF